MTTQNLTGFAVVTGAASGIGQETAYQLAESGATGILFADLNEAGAHASAEKSRSLASNPEYKALAVKVDVTSKTSVQGMVDRAVEEFGRVDYGVHCAGIGVTSRNPITSPSEPEYHTLWDTNLMGTVRVTSSLAAAMSSNPIATTTGRSGTREIGRGAIVNLASADGCVVEPGKAPYIASKHAVMGVSKTAALENAAAQIRINALCPTWVDTPMMEADFGVQPELRGVIGEVHPKKRMAVAEEVASCVLFLLGPGASYISGTGLVIDHGVLLTVNAM